MRRSLLISNKNKKGFTLIELLVFIGILSLIGIVFLGLQYVVTQNQLSVWKNYLNIDDANRILTEMAKELRNAKESDLGSYPLTIANDQEIAFYSDYDSDGDTERIRYKLNSSSLEKGVIEPVGNPIIYPVAQEKITTLTSNIRNLSSPLFYYYNNDWPEDVVNNPLATDSRISDTRIVYIYLRLNSKADEQDKDFILDTYVKVRMLR